MNPNLELLQPYPFEKLRLLLSGIEPSSKYRNLPMQIGEPKHPTPDFIKDALARNLEGLAVYPPTIGSATLREAIVLWIQRRYPGVSLDPARDVLPVNGSREALFAFAQTVLGGARECVVVCPNPFYQIYEGAALLAGARAYFVNASPGSGFAVDYSAVPDDVWKKTQLVFVCSPGNPTGRVMPQAEWTHLFKLSDKFGFVIASDECYSEIYPDESSPPLGALQAAHAEGRHDFRNLVVFSSLSKRSNAPGLRSGFVAGDADLIRPFLLYRTYHGGAMSPVIQEASRAAWSDEAHVVENRRRYSEKYAAVLPIVPPPLRTWCPDGGFYLWIKTPIDDVEFARDLYATYNVTVLPGSFLAREAHGVNPGRNYIRVALVASKNECVEGILRISEFSKNLGA